MSLSCLIHIHIFTFNHADWLWNLQDLCLQQKHLGGGGDGARLTAPTHYPQALCLLHFLVFTVYTSISCLTVRATLLCSSPGFLLLSLTCPNVPIQSGGETDITPLSFLCYNLWTPPHHHNAPDLQICCTLLLWKNLSLVVIIMIISFIIQGNLLLLSSLWRSKFMVSYKGSRFQLDGCLHKGLNPGLSVKEQPSYYTTVLAFFLSNVSPILTLQHWVTGSGHNLMACLWPASGVKQVF